MRLFTERRLTFGLLCVALVVSYLIWWSTYAASSQSDQYSRLAPGAAFESSTGTARVLSLQSADQLTGVKAADPQAAAAGATWVVATVELVVRQASDRTWCDVQLVSTTRRVWPEGGPSVERALPGCSDADIVLNQPYRFEAVFLVPTSDIDTIAGVALRDTSVRRRVPILSPPS